MADGAEQQDRQTTGPEIHGYVSLTWRRWPLCIVVPLALGVATYLLTGLLRKWYEAATTVRVASVEYGPAAMNLVGITPKALETSFQSGEVLGKVVSDLNLLKDYGIDAAHLAGSLLDVSVPRGASRIDIRARMPSPELARDVVTRIAEDGIAHYEKALTAEYETMVRKLDKEAKQLKSLLDKAEADLEQFQAEHRMETLAQRVAIRRTLYAEREEKILALRADLEVHGAKITAYEKQLKDQDLSARVERILADSPPLQQAQAELAKAQADLEAFRKRSRIDTLRAEVAVQQELKSKREADRTGLKSQQAGIREKIDALKKLLAEESPTVKLDRSLVKDPAFQQALAKLTGKAVEELLALTMTESVVNRVYVALREALANATSEDRRMTGQLAAMGQAAKEGDVKLAVLQDRLFTQERELAALTLQQELASKRVLGAAEAVAQDRGVVTPLYLRAVQKLIAAKSEEAAVRAELKVLEEAAQELQSTLASLEQQLYKVERMHRDKTFQRDRARTDAAKAMADLQALRSIPRWPPVSLTVAPAALPSEPVSPRRLRLAVASVVLSGFAAWAVAVLLDRRRRS